MILGIGTDLANIDRIEATLARFGDRFRDRVFTEREQRKAEPQGQQSGTHAAILPIVVNAAATLCLGFGRRQPSG